MATLKLRAALLAMLLGGCTVGPDFVRPVVDAPSRWWGSAQDVPRTVTYGGEVDAAWWDSFHDPELSALVGRLAKQNLGLQEAAERVQQGRAQRQVAASQGLPHLDAQAQYQRERQSPTGPISLFQAVPGAPLSFDVFTDSLNASWELDLFGRVRRAVEAQDADTEAAIEARHGIALMAISDLAQDYLQLRGTQRLEAITSQYVAEAERNAALVHDRFDNGVSTTLDIANAEAQRASIAAMLPQLRATRAELINAIGFLLAEPPRALEGELAAPAPLPDVPPSVPIGLPGELARRRPDVREAEARLHAATAETGVAVTDFYPDVTLNGMAGTQSLQFARVFDLHSGMFQVGPSIDLPIFEGGRLRGTLRLRRSQQREAALQFRSTVLQAWQEVDNALTAYAEAQRRREQVAEAVRQYTAALAAARQRYQEGAIDFLNVIAAESSVLQNENVLANSDTQIATDLVALYRALGGGWELADR